MSRCAAPVLSAKALGLRSSRDPSRRCQRTAQVRLRCAFGLRPFCRPHARLWREHNAIVARILAIPASPAP